MKQFLKRREVTLTVLLAAFIALVSLRAPGFASPGNMGDILNDTAVLMLAAAAQFLILLLNGIDLSIPSMMALTGMLVSMLNMAQPNLPIPVVVATALAIGLVLGAANGLLVGGLKLPPIIATLGTIAIYRALVFVVSGGEWVSAHEMSELFVSIPQRTFLGVPGILWYTGIALALVGLFLTFVPAGRAIYAVGGNPTASRLAGIKNERVLFMAFTLSGVISGLAGLLYVTRYAAAQNDTALGYELQAVAACVIGGVSVVGGSGNIVGVVLGAMFLGLLYNALTVVNLSPFYQMAIQGIAILVAIIANTVVDRNNRRNMLARRKLA